MDARAKVHRWDDIALDKVTEMVSRKTMTGEGWTMAQVYLKKGALSPIHAHPGQQCIYVLQGSLAVTIDGEAAAAVEGETIEVPAGAMHHAEALDDCFVLEIRYPGPAGAG